MRQKFLSWNFLRFVAHIPNAKRNEIIGWHNGYLKIAIQASPSGGKANKALIAFLADYLDIPVKKTEA